MNKCEQFLSFFDSMAQKLGEPIPQEVKEFYDMLKEKHVEKPMFTDSGLEIFEYLQNCDAKSLKAKDIADGMGISSRKVSGAIRKLCSDGYVEKYGQSPVIYSLTEQGKNFNINEYKESLKNEKENEE